MASGLGLTEFDGRLDDLSAAAFQAAAQDGAPRGGRASGRCPTPGSRPDERIDRDFVDLDPRPAGPIMGDWASWRRQPELYVGPGPAAASSASSPAASTPRPHLVWTPPAPAWGGGTRDALPRARANLGTGLASPRCSSAVESASAVPAVVYARDPSLREAKAPDLTWCGSPRPVTSLAAAPTRTLPAISLVALGRHGDRRLRPSARPATLRAPPGERAPRASRRRGARDPG